MKRGILGATLIVAVAGVVGANLLTGSQGGPSARAQAAGGPPRVLAKAPDKALDRVPGKALPSPAVAVAAPVAAPTIQRVSVEPRQAPVPLLMKARPAANLPVVDDRLGGGVGGDTEAAAPGDAEAEDRVGERAAKAAIEADGYKGVKVLRRGANGVWHASALRGTTAVMLTVDAGGSVSAD